MSVDALESYLGKNINQICKNNFHDPDLNHCAHFVSHVVGMSFSYHCADYQGGNKPAGNIRVHEIFPECPRVGLWANANLRKSQLIFVTRKDVVNIATKTMRNIPQKHIGIFHNGMVYHYSNGEDKVVKQTPDDFYERFQRIYDGDQGLFFGEFPHSDLVLSVELDAANITRGVGFALRKQNGLWLAKRTDDGSPEFLVGAEVNQPARGYCGIQMRTRDYYGPIFKGDEYAQQLDHWAYLLDITASGEGGGYFNVINTYDRARFTFGFYQLAAHTPQDNLILMFREALLNAEFKSLFPDLKLIGGRVFRVAQDGTETSLEEEIYDPASEEMQLQRFMTYLNPNRALIDEQEVLQSARMIWWSNYSAAGRAIQVKTASDILQRKMSRVYNGRYNLDGRSDTICSIIGDIHHQGRGKVTDVRAALNSNQPVENLIMIGSQSYPGRAATLRARIKHWTDRGILGVKRYKASLNQFQ